MTLNDNQWVHGEHPKTQVVLHHTASTSSASADDVIAYWNSNTPRVATEYIIDRWGVVTEVFSPHKGWAFHTGLGNGDAHRIGIELINNGIGDEYPIAQVAACAKLVNDLCSEFNIKKNLVMTLQYFDEAEGLPGVVSHRNLFRGNIDPSKEFKRDLLYKKLTELSSEWKWIFPHMTKPVTITSKGE